MPDGTPEGPLRGPAPIGPALKAARREAGLTPYELSTLTRIRPAMLLRFEADDFSGCGGDVYARGHLRKTAIAVGLDPAPLLAAFDARAGTPAGGHRYALGASELMRRPRPPRNWSLVLAVALAVLLAYGVALAVAAATG